MVLKIAGQLRRHLSRESFVCGGRVVSRSTEDADLVLHLHHQDGVLAVDLADMGHQCSEGSRIGVLRGAAKSTQDIHLVPADHHAGKAFGVALHPDRWVARHTVFPRGKPEEDDALVALPRLRK